MWEKHGLCIDSQLPKAQLMLSIRPSHMLLFLLFLFTFIVRTWILVQHCWDRITLRLKGSENLRGDYHKCVAFKSPKSQGHLPSTLGQAWPMKQTHQSPTAAVCLAPGSTAAPEWHFWLTGWVGPTASAHTSWRKTRWTPFSTVFASLAKRPLQFSGLVDCSRRTFLLTRLLSLLWPLLL